MALLELAASCRDPSMGKKRAVEPAVVVVAVAGTAVQVASALHTVAASVVRNL